MSTRSTRNSKSALFKELELSDGETESNNKPTTKKTTTSSNKEGKQKNNNNHGSGSNSDDEYSDHDSDSDYSDVEEKKQQQQKKKKKKGSGSRTSSNKNKKKSTTTNGSSGGGGTAKQKRTRDTGSGGNLVEGAATDATAREFIANSLMNGNVETLGKSLDNLRFDLELEVVKTIGNNTKGTAEDNLANEESKLKILEKEYAELIAKNKKDEEECYLLYQEGKDIRAITHRMRMRILQLDCEEEIRARILAVAKERLYAIQLFTKVRDVSGITGITEEEAVVIADNFDVIQEKIISVNEENAGYNMKVYIAILLRGLEMKALRIFYKSREVGMYSITEEEVAIVAANLHVIDNTIGAASKDDELRWNERLAVYNTQLH